MTRLPLGGAALIVTALVVAPVAVSEPGVYLHEDESFYRLLIEGTEDLPGTTLTNPPLVRAQGLTACQRMDEGVGKLDAIEMLMAEGPYAFDTAATIVTSAVVGYCLDHVGI